MSIRWDLAVVSNLTIKLQNHTLVCVVEQLTERNVWMVLSVQKRHSALTLGHQGMLPTELVAQLKQKYN